MPEIDELLELKRRVGNHLSAHQSSYYHAREAGDDAAMDRCAARTRVCMDVLAGIRQLLDQRKHTT